MFNKWHVLENTIVFSNSFYSIQLFDKSFKTWKINYFAIFLKQLLHSYKYMP
jgi:hypothetical protein